MATASSITGPGATPSTSDIAKVALASWFGTLVEAYDFLIVSTISVIAWPTVFFPNASLVNAVVFSISVFVAGYIARPLGGMVFAHFGDRYGRRIPLLASLILMGLATLTIGLVPPFNTTGVFPGIGIWGGILVSVCRILQGLGYGGEFSSAATWIAEFANKSKHRSVWTGILPQGVAVATFFSSFTVTMLLSVFSRAAFLDWGWRVPFFIGSTVALIGMVIRYRLTEAPMFKQFLEKGIVVRKPSLTVLKEMPGTVLKLSGSMIWYAPALSTATVFGVAYMQQVSKVSAAFAASTVLLVSVALGSGTFAGSLLANSRIGRRGTFLVAQIGVIAVAFPYIMMLGSGNPIVIYVAQCLLVGIAYIGVGCIYSFETELFPTKFRVSGGSWGHNLSVLLGSFAPLIAASIVATGGMSAWPFVALVLVAYGGVAVVSTLLLPEPGKGPLRED